MPRLLGVLLASVLLASLAAAQQTNGVTTLMQETVTAGGERVGGGNPMRLVTSIGQPFGDVMQGTTGAIRSGYSPTLPPRPPGMRTITLLGSVNEPAASVKVNGTPTTVDTAGTFSAPVTLTEGPNTITVAATDPVGHVTTTAVTVTLDTRPPAMPTVVNPPAVTTAPSYTLTGTKTPNTSIWINGTQVVPLDGTMSWMVTLSLAEGDNVLVIVTKDAAGNPSATVTRNIIVDNLPPVINNVTYLDPQGAPLHVDPTTSLPKTNFSTVTIAGLVDDSLTTVVINNVTATRTGRSFSASLPLAAAGSSSFSLTATSPNAYVTTASYTVARGTIPTLKAVQPPDGTILYAVSAATIQGTATDPEQDAIFFQLSVDGAPVGAWVTTNALPWLPGLPDLGLHTITMSARDDYGGTSTMSLQVFVVRKPVEHP